jgi:hypothetical protein
MITTDKPRSMADLGSMAAPNWQMHSHRDPDFRSDYAQTMRDLACVISNQGLHEVASNALRTIKEIDAAIDSERLACADYRRQYVKTYNLCREQLITRQSQRRYRGELLELLDFIPGVRQDRY